MKVIKYLLFIAAIISFVSNAAINVRIAITGQSNSPYIIQIKGDKIFKFSGSSLNILAEEFFTIKDPITGKPAINKDLFTFASTEINNYKKIIQTLTDLSLTDLYNKQKSFFSLSTPKDIPSFMRTKLITTIDLFDEQVKKLFINNLTEFVQQDINKNGLPLDISQDNELTRPFRSLYTLVRNLCATIYVETTPLETTLWKWGRRGIKTAFYSSLLVGSAYFIYKLSDYLPYPETVGEAVTTGLIKTGSGLQALEKTGRGMFESIKTIKLPKVPTSVPKSAPPTGPSPYEI